MGTALTVASLPVFAQEQGTAAELGVMSIQLKDIIKTQVGVQTQAAGSPNRSPSQQMT